MESKVERSILALILRLFSDCYYCMCRVARVPSSEL